MAAIATLFAEQTTQQTTTSTSYGDVTGCTLTGFTAGKKYLILVCAAAGSLNSTAETGLQVVHGTTAFADSEQSGRPNGTGLRLPYAWFTVWTAVTGEDVKLQMKTTASTGQVDQVCMFAMNLSDDVTENTDWFFNEVATDSAITTAGVDGASITFTPGAAAHDWLVLTYSQIDITSTTASTGTRLARSGEASSTTPDATIEGLNTTEQLAVVLMRAFSLGAASNTFKEVAVANTSDNGTRLHSKVFALDLNKFAERVNEYTAGPTSLSATDYATQLETASLTPGVTGDVLALAYTTFDRNNASRELEIRLQVDGADQPDTQTTDNHQFYSGRDARDQLPFFIFTRENLSNAAHAFDLDASSDATTGTPECDDTSVVAFTMELAAAAGTSVNPGAGTLTITGHAPTVSQPVVADPGAGTVTLTGHAPTVAQDTPVAPGAGTVTITGHAPTVEQPVVANPEPGTLTISGHAPLVAQGTYVEAGTGSISITGHAPTVEQPVVANPSAGALTITGYAPTVTQPVVTNPDAGAVTLTGHAPTVTQESAGASQEVNPAAGQIVINGYAPTVMQSRPESSGGGGKRQITFDDVDDALEDAMIARQNETIVHLIVAAITNGMLE